MNKSLLVNALGHSAGVLIFGIFLYLLIQDRAARRLAGSTKSMIAAALALLWNFASLIVLGSSSPSSETTTIIAAVSFSVLSLLPAVLFDLCLIGRFRWLVRLGYSLSGATIVLHVAEVFDPGSDFHAWGLTLTTVGFGALTCIAAIAVLVSRADQREDNRRAATSRLVGTMTLLLLAMSFVHFKNDNVVQVWSRELAFHHAAIPLALLILLQDYRFVLLDAFLRFLANVLLAAIFTAGAVEVWRLDLVGRPSTPFALALLLTGASLLLIVFALARAGLQKLLTRLVFRSPDRDALLAKLKTPVHEEREYLRSAAALLGEFMGAAVIEGPIEGAAPLRMDVPRPAIISDVPRDRARLENAGVEVVIPLRLASLGTEYVLLGRRSGGRRYLSEDLQALGRAAAQIVEQVEQFRESEMRRLVAQAELRALQSQIHPHFLFNALNTLYGIIPREATGARETVLNLADIFRYFLETEKSFLPLEEELRIVTAYLEVERLRLGAKLRIEIEVEPAALLAPIPILSIQPLVENAVKHGISPKADGGLVRLEARVASGLLHIAVTDTGGGFTVPRSGAAAKSGVGLDNVNRRLQLCYGSETRVTVQSDRGGSSVSFAIPLAHNVAAGRASREMEERGAARAIEAAR